GSLVSWHRVPDVLAIFGNSFLMSKVINVSQKLGQYMLSGWVLTDVPCSTCRVPLMRSPQGRLPTTHFCANCDNDPDTSSSSNDSKYSDASTPPTEVSNPPDSPQFMPLQDTEDIRRRREQSDRASQEIGNRLLQGWAMLADECPGPTCYGVPLVRPPKAGGEKVPRKECVICEVDSMGRQHLTPLNVINQNLNSSRAETPSSNMQVVPTVPDAVTQTSHDVTSRFTASSLPRQDKGHCEFSGKLHPIRQSDAFLRKDRGTETLYALEESSESLQSALRTLSARLESLSRKDIPVDPPAIGSTADAILKVTQALSQVRQLEQSERQGRSL
ncbi:hypothetical protein F5887DRAFT_937999, partial [Amanita rubescens]